MKNETLSYILRRINLSKCTYLRDGLYYIKTEVKQKVYNSELQKERIRYIPCEFIIVTENNIKKSIIHKCDFNDLHWYTFIEWRNKGVLSNALRSGIIKECWPEIQSITCQYEWNENKVEKYRKTEHLASLAGLTMRETFK